MSRRWKSWMKIVGVRVHSHRCHVRSRQEERRKEEEGFIFRRSLTGPSPAYRTLRAPSLGFSASFVAKLVSSTPYRINACLNIVEVIDRC